MQFFHTKMKIASLIVITVFPMIVFATGSNNGDEKSGFWSNFKSNRNAKNILVRANADAAAIVQKAQVAANEMQRQAAEIKAEAVNLKQSALRFERLVEARARSTTGSGQLLCKRWTKKRGSNFASEEELILQQGYEPFAVAGTYGDLHYYRRCEDWI
jgi:hypothetical protein